MKFDCIIACHTCHIAHRFYIMMSRFCCFFIFYYLCQSWHAMFGIPAIENQSKFKKKEKKIDDDKYRITTDFEGRDTLSLVS